MSQMMHILRKDLRHLRWLLVLWALILITRVVLSAIGAGTAGATFPAMVVFRELSVVLSIVPALMMALLVSRLVHDEPLVGWNAFWLTRPYSSSALLSAKLLFLATVLVIAPLIADLVTMSIFHAGPRAQLAAAPSFLFGHLTWALAVCVVAALTPSLAAFVLAIIGSVVALVVTILLLFSVAIAFAGEQTFTGDLSMLPDPTPGFVSLLVFVASALAVVIYQYRHRRWRIALVLACAGLVATVFLPGYWPWPFLRPQPPDPGQWARNTQATQVTIDPRMALNMSREVFDSAAPPRRRIHAFAVLTGTPPEFANRGVTVNGTLTLPDSTTVRSRQNDSFSREWGSTEGLVLPDTETPAHAALGDVTVLNDIEKQRYEQWPVMLSLTAEEHARYKGQKGRFEATLDFHMYRTRERGTLPLRDGSALDDGLSRIEVMRATPIDGGYRLVVRYWHALPPKPTGNRPTYEFFLRNRPARAAVALRSVDSWSGSFSGHSVGGRVASAVLPGFSIGSSPGGFDVQTQVLEFPWRMQGGYVGVARLEPAWFDDAELVVLETAYAGTVTRSVNLPDFTIPEE
jgi:hypothetical protein